MTSSPRDPATFPRLETDRLILRVPCGADLDAWAALLADEDSARFIGGPMPREAAWRTMAAMAGSWVVKGFGMFSVVEKTSDRCIGRAGPWQPEGWPGTEVGWALLKDSWGRGYAQESARAAIGWAFDTLGWREVIHIIAPENEASRRLAARLGASNTGATQLPPPLDRSSVEIWRQSREEWERAGGRYDTLAGTKKATP